MGKLSIAEMEKLPTNCRLHEDRLANLEDSLGTIITNVDELIKRDNDFEIAVINGKTTYRKASELLGEMYLAIKELKQQTPTNMVKQFGVIADNLLKIAMLIGLLFTMFKVFHN